MKTIPFSPTVVEIPNASGSAAFVKDSASVFREDYDTAPSKVNDTIEFMPWGADNEMPYNILNLIESDETVQTCLQWNAQMTYGSGLRYNSEAADKKTQQAVADWLDNNNLASYFLGVANDIKCWGFAVSVIILDKAGKNIARLIRKEAIYCRFAPVNRSGIIDKVYYAQWRNIVSAKDIEVIPALDERCPLADLRSRIAKNTRDKKFAIVTRIPTVDSTYYPIPYWASLLKGKWYNIKQLISTAKEAKLRNTAPIKYLIEISEKYFQRIFAAEGITDFEKQKERVKQAKDEIVDFLSGVENSGKTLFSTFYTPPTGQEVHDVKITRIDAAKEGGDWSTDVQEAVNMICFTMQVHSNLVGSVPGKSQSNNSGSDKRELYTIAQALQKPTHDILYTVQRVVIRFNGWKNVFPEVPFIQLTTLDEKSDAKVVKIDEGGEE